jgi:oligopeptidase B
MTSVPIAKRIPHQFEQHGRTYTDYYQWLHKKDDPEVIAYLESENEYANTVLAHTKDLQEALYQEMFGRIAEDDQSAPERRGGYEYYTRVRAGEQYRLFCRREVGSTEETILIDENKLAEGLQYCRVYIFEPSPDQNLLAYAVDTTGAWVFELYIKDLRTGEILAGPIKNTAWGVAWASDNKTLFYAVFNDAHRPYKIFRHRVGTDPAQDVEVYHEADEAFNAYVSSTRSGQYLLINIESMSTGEVRTLRADQPEGEFRVIAPRQTRVEYRVEHYGDTFYIVTNEDAENFKLMATSVEAPERANWREVIPHRPDVLLYSIQAFKDHLVLVERRGGFVEVRIAAPDKVGDLVNDLHYVEFPEPVYAVAMTENPEYDTPMLRFTYTSLITPNSTVDYDVRTRVWDVKKRQVIPSGYDPELYVSERLEATAPDGARVPMSIVYRKGTPRDGSAPCLLYGYGSYGIPMEASFNTNRLSLLDRGFVYAIAHIRGGTEMGRGWYENGRLMHKKNTFTDFIACGEHLIAQRYTSPDRLAIMGGSAGGLLVSAVVNMRPDLMKAALAIVPFTNVITAMLMPELPLTVPEWEQWGNPNDPQAFDYMMSYSPYDNIEAKAYPHIYVQTGINDLQVPYWDPAKWVAALRFAKTDANRLVFFTNMGAGHSGASGRYDSLRETARMFAFLIDTVCV